LYISFDTPDQVPMTPITEHGVFQVVVSQTEVVGVVVSQAEVVALAVEELVADGEVAEIVGRYSKLVAKISH
jgi:hypothetical protein